MKRLFFKIFSLLSAIFLTVFLFSSCNQPKTAYIVTDYEYTTVTGVIEYIYFYESGAILLELEKTNEEDQTTSETLGAVIIILENKKIAQENGFIPQKNETYTFETTTPLMSYTKKSFRAVVGIYESDNSKTYLNDETGKQNWLNYCKSDFNDRQF